jgi:hypothetical protein
VKVGFYFVAVTQQLHQIADVGRRYTSILQSSRGSDMQQISRQIFDTMVVLFFIS